MGKKIPFVFAALFALTINSALAQEANLLTNCERLYQSNKFPEAKAALGELLTKYPQDASAHYLLGNVYVRMQDKTKALIEYSSAIQFDKTGQVAAYARAGINALTPDGGATTPNSAGGATPSNQQDRDQQNLRTSVQSVSHEVDRKNIAGSAEFDRRMKQIFDDGIIERKRIQQDYDDRKAQLTVERYRNGPNGPIPIYDRATNDMARQIDMDYRNKLRALTENEYKRRAEAQQDFNARQGASESSAMGIESSFATGQGSSSVKLMPAGTTLYNRNYQTFGDPSGNAIPVSAPPAKSLNQR